MTEISGVVDVEQDRAQQALPDLQALAALSRRAESAARQDPRRKRDEEVRRQAVRFAASVRTEGCSCRQAARRLCLSPRTLSHWCCQEQKGETCQCRGRPCKESPFEKRLAVAEFLRDTGLGVGVPSLRVVFPQMPPCELTDLRRRYWRTYRRHNRIAMEELSWHAPGRVWAMDHAKAPQPVDGLYPSLLAVRDLASGMTLAWLPVPDETAATTRDALVALFREFGAPLVLKSDNGSAFKAEVRALLDDWCIVPLPSPPRTPRYNGSCEAGIGGLKTRTHHQAALAGHPGIWTSEDTEAARRAGNEFRYPDGHQEPTALAVWQRRTPLDPDERQGIRLTIERLRRQIHQGMDSASRASLTAADQAAIHRRVVRRALVELGILSTTWRRITLPLKSKKLAKIS